MGSGMTTSTATKGRPCDGYIRDPNGLRTHEECDIVLDPNFGFLQVVYGECSDPFLICFGCLVFGPEVLFFVGPESLAWRVLIFKQRDPSCFLFLFFFFFFTFDE